MGILNLKQEPYHNERITNMLNRRGLAPITSEIWEVHGPHGGMAYQVYVGYVASTDDANETYCVVVWPERGVYEIDQPSVWGNINNNRRFTAA
jgi:hypothetical protein